VTARQRKSAGVITIVAGDCASESTPCDWPMPTARSLSLRAISRACPERHRKCTSASAQLRRNRTECAQVLEEHDLFLNHAPVVIAISLPAPSRAAPPRTAPAPTERRTARPTPTRAGKAVKPATWSDPYPSSPPDPPATPAAANDGSLLNEVIVGVGKAELSRRCARHGGRPIGSCAKRKRSRKGCDCECSRGRCQRA
jgi:hypothetical protein